MIEISKVSKIYKLKKKGFGNNEIVHAVKDVSLSIEEGEIVGLLGLNGSGKSTLLKCLTGIIQPDIGTIRIGDLDPHRDRKKLIYNMGVIFGQKSSFVEDLSVEDNLLVFKSLYKISNKQYNEEMDYINSYLDFKSLLEKPFRKLSFGQRVKCELVSILLHKPKLLFLDEPTIGLDILVKDELFAFLKEYNEKTKAIIVITTHELDILDNFCNRIVIMDHGEKLLDLSPDEIKTRMRIRKKITVKYDRIKDELLLEELKNMVLESKQEKNQIEFLISDKAEDMKIFEQLYNSLVITDIETNSIGLQEAIKQIYV